MSKAFELLEIEYEKQRLENRALFTSYLDALYTLKEEVDLKGLLDENLKENFELRKEVERLNALAQLGISVEIIGHEIEGLDQTITRGLKTLPDKVKASPAFDEIQTAHQALSDKWRFLSPLKLSGEKIKKDISGDEIYQYVSKFFGSKLDSANIDFKISDSFKSFKIYEQPTRLFPVFINLVNNARYWVQQNDSDNKTILLEYKDREVIIADNGVGVEQDDLDKLFTLFFSRRAKGGRGIGLYLCRTNLAAGGHTIYYQADTKRKVLSGANFVIKFKGLDNVSN